ncbi:MULTISPECIES: STAS domain-containing protein [Actinomadura]|uniref:Anti-sigma factor antagonist n=1 Tax=Actinomadura yumaensis TaxID=111807 RepID=A0ABW2CLE5_9ACTN|nr:STAS domain-containing protein [Actinomadura sp. J1-007]MWK36591.1 anti-sigma factor antagonist [Actinomadura sp. J1-007]
MSHAHDLRISMARTLDGIAVLAVEGELNLTTSTRLSDTALTVAGDQHPHLILDLSRVPFCDSSGLNALIVLYRRLKAGHGSLTLAAVPDRLTRLLTHTGVNRLIPTHPTTDSALTTHPHATSGTDSHTNASRHSL